MDNKELLEYENKIKASQERLKLLEDRDKQLKQQINADRASDNISVIITFIIVGLVILGFIFFPEFMS